MRFSKETTYLPHMLGDEAEAIALEYLEKQGLKLVEQNYGHQPFGEIDLIMYEKNVLVFIEVRMRTHYNFVTAAASVTKSKKQKLNKTATIYLLENKLMYKVPCRFDVIALKNSDKGIQVDWIKHAFEVKTK